MKFRRRTFRRGVRRPSLFQMQPLHLCPFALVIPEQNPPPSCIDPIKNATEMINLQGAQAPLASLQSLTKGILVRGINFQYEYSTVGEGDLGADGYLEFRSAFVRLPKDPITAAPSFLPNLFNPNEVLVTERVLWRGLDVMWTWDNSISGGDSRLGGRAFSSSLMPGNASAQPNIRIKTACRVKENEGIFFVSNVIHSFINTGFHIGLTLFGSAAVRQIVT